MRWIDKRTTKERRSELSASGKRRWSDPAYREKMHILMNSPECKEKISNAAKSRMKDPDVIENLRKKAIEQWNDQDYRDRKTVSAKTWWQDPAHTARIKEQRNAPEYKNRVSEQSRSRWATNEYREKMRDAMSYRSSEEYKEKMSKAQVIRWSRPGEKVKISGQNSSSWKGGISFEPYCPKFNKDLRHRIRAYFDNRCIICGKTESENATRAGKPWKLSCHHVEYNKQACCDGKPIHFASLCMLCHIKTNADRARWEAMIHRIIDEIYEGRSYYTKDEWADIVSGGGNGA